VEALAEWIAMQLLIHQKFSRVGVEVRKPSVFSHADGPGVFVERSLDDSTVEQKTPMIDGWDTALQFEAK
jgi:hypothetical protein